MFYFDEAWGVYEIDTGAVGHFDWCFFRRMKMEREMNKRRFFAKRQDSIGVAQGKDSLQTGDQTFAGTFEKREVRFIVHRLFLDSVGDFVEAPEVASTYSDNGSAKEKVARTKISLEKKLTIIKAIESVAFLRYGAKKKTI
ncbi:hypothetical protein LAZ67_7000123 [Cordylochernes scorpioides]|uniref:Uncharacterized protein n=1 Tax=Cordylochernes scorpioides TaxID=51811 RepID=A0ABY6KLD6_9ARAC|nr:hypothetical protein LAZ67_7000123 [Cordylochernes scorpioides]